MSPATCVAPPASRTFAEWIPGLDERTAFALIGRPAQITEDFESIRELSEALRLCIDEVNGFVAALRDAGQDHCADSCAHALQFAINRAESALAAKRLRAD